MNKRSAIAVAAPKPTPIPVYRRREEIGKPLNCNRGFTVKPCFVCPQTYRATGVVLTAESMLRVGEYVEDRSSGQHVAIEW